MINLFDYEQAAREKLSTMAFEYFWGGSDDEVTLRDNRAAFDAFYLRPRMLVDVSQIDMTVKVIGQTMPAPLLIAPMAYMKLAHPEGEIAMTRGLGALGLTFCLSTRATVSLEEVKQTATAPLWFQLYVFKDRELTRSLVQRAEAAGYTALVVTVDNPILGKRERDIRNHFKIPDGMISPNLNDPNFRRDAVTQPVAYYDSAMTWEDLHWLQSITSLPIVVKGILRGDDAARSIEYGAAGIIVSNHGGRQLDTAIPAILALPEIVAAVAGRVDVLIDGGFRRGTDIVKALAMGAKAVMIGRPVLWGLAINGEQGVIDVMQILINELKVAMMLCGCSDLSTITPDLIRTKGF